MRPDWTSPTSDAIQYRSRSLENLRVGAQYVATRAAFETQHDAMTDRLVMQLRSYVLADRVASDTYRRTVPVPASWWQHWKRDKAPAWFVRRFPVAETQIHVEVGVTRYLTYPDASIQMPNLGAYVIQEIVS